MANVFELKEQSVAETPLLLFDCELDGGVTDTLSILLLNSKMQPWHE
jgi:hypothetical protein